MRTLPFHLTALFFILLFPLGTQASFPEMYGASSSTLAVGAQARSHQNDPSNNYYAPSLLGFSDKLQLQASTFWAQTDFEEFGTLKVENEWTRLECSYPNCSSTVAANRDPLWMNAFHLSVPLIGPQGPRLGLSAFVPMKSLMEVRSGDPLLPEYVLYNSRNARTQIFANLAYAFNPNFSASLGVYNGFQVGMDVYTYARVGADKTSYSSYAKSEALAKPSFAAIASLALKFQSQAIYFTLTQEMKSKLSGKASGLSDDPQIPFAIQINSLAFYDPMTLRIGHSIHSSTLALLTSLEWQKWDHYQAPIAHLKQEGGVIVGSKILERLELRNILVPKIGLEYLPLDFLPTRVGLSYRPSPLKGNFSGPGNSIDSDVLSINGGGGLKGNLWGQELEGQLGVEYQKLKSKTVSKSAGREDGGSGDKVGSPGYKIGGKVWVMSLGLGASF